MHKLWRRKWPNPEHNSTAQPTGSLLAVAGSWTIRTRSEMINKWLYDRRADFKCNLYIIPTQCGNETFNKATVINEEINYICRVFKISYVFLENQNKDDFFLVQVDWMCGLLQDEHIIPGGTNQSSCQSLFFCIQNADKAVMNPPILKKWATKPQVTA